MGRKRCAPAAAAALAIVAVLTGCQPVQPWQNRLATPNAAGTDSPAGYTFGASVSPDGTKMAFVSQANDLGPADSPRGNPSSAVDDADVYLRDLTTGKTTLVSANAGGTDSGNGPSQEPVWSPDGTRIAFTSKANDLGPTDSARPSPAVPGFLDDDVYLYDLATGTVTLVSADAAGTDSGDWPSQRPVFSPDGTELVFESYASDLGPHDSERTTTGLVDFFDEVDIYVRDLATGTTSLVSANAAGTDSADGQSIEPWFSPDGHRVLFASTGDDFGPADHVRVGNPFGDIEEYDLYVRDLATATTDLVTANVAGTDSADAATAFVVPSFSPDGSRVAFGSFATDLVATDTNGQMDVFVRDLDAGTTRLVSGNAAGTDSADGRSESPRFGPDGRQILFTTSANDLGPADTGTVVDLYRRDLPTGTASLVSVDRAGIGGGNGDTTIGTFSPDGTRIAFATSASNLGPRDTNGRRDLYVRDLRTATTTLVSTIPGGTDGGDGDSDGDAVFLPGGRIAFGSAAGNLDGADTNGTGDIYIATLHGADLRVTLDAGQTAGTTSAAGGNGGGGRRLTYTLGVSNAGPDAAERVTAVVRVPDGTTVRSVTDGGATCSVDRRQRLVACALGTVDADADVTVTIEVGIARTAPRPLVAFAAVSSPTVDPAYGNNTTATVVD